MEQKAIPYGRQNITQDDINAVIETLQSDFLTQGPKILEFEEVFANYIGSKYAVAVANGTAALHLCTLALEVKKGQKVITTPITFAASANCVRYCDGEVVFADIDPETYLIDFESVKYSKSVPSLDKIILPVPVIQAASLSNLKALLNQFYILRIFFLEACSLLIYKK